MKRYATDHEYEQSVHTSIQDFTVADPDELLSDHIKRLTEYFNSYQKGKSPSFMGKMYEKNVISYLKDKSMCNNIFAPILDKAFERVTKHLKTDEFKSIVHDLAESGTHGFISGLFNRISTSYDNKPAIESPFAVTDHTI